MAARPVAIIAGQLVLGGAERQLYLWLAHLDRSRFSPVVVTLHPDCGDYWESAVEQLDLPLLRVPRSGNRIARLLRIVRALRPHRPELVHGWHLFASPYAGAAARILGARASLGSLRGSFAAYRAQRAGSFLTEQLTDALLVNSRAAASQMRENGRRRRRIYTVPNAVEDAGEDRASARRRLAETWNVPEDRLWIGSAGRFQYSKRFDLLLDLTARLVAAGENVHLFLMGYGQLEGSLRAQAVRLHVVDRVTFTGEDARARLWMSALDLFCFPSMDEGLPNAVMEAAAAGVPVAGWRTPFLEEVLDGSAALAEPGDMDGLERTVIGLLRDREARRELGRNGRRHVLDSFSVSRFVQGLTGAYEELLSLR